MTRRTAATVITVGGSVLLLDDDADLLEVMADFIERLCKRTCLRLTSYAELVAHASESLACDVALLDVNLGAGQPSGVDAYYWLKRNGFHGRIYFFTGHASMHPLPAELEKLHEVEVLAKPVASKTLVELLR